MFDQAFQQFLVRLAMELMSVFLPILALALLGLCKKGWDYITLRLKNEQPDIYAKLSEYAKEAVFAAEVAGIKGLAEDKKQYAIDFVQRELDARGFSGIDVSVIEDKIEAALFAEINKDKAK